MYRKKVYCLGASSYRRVLFFGLVAKRFIVPAGIDSNENKERSFRASSQLCLQFGRKQILFVFSLSWGTSVVSLVLMVLCEDLEKLYLFHSRRSDSDAQLRMNVN